MKVVGDSTEKISNDVISSMAIDTSGVLHMGDTRVVMPDTMEGIRGERVGWGTAYHPGGRPLTKVLADTKGRVWYSSYLNVNSYAHGLFMQEKGQWIEFTDRTAFSIMKMFP